MVAAEFLLEHLSRTLYDPVDPTKVVSLDPKLRFKMNGEIFRFSSQKTLDIFRRDPGAWSSILRDPVTGQRFIVSSDLPSYQHTDGPYYFTCDSTMWIFSFDPKRYEIVRDY